MSARPGREQGAGRARWARWARAQAGDLGTEPSSLASALQLLCVRMDTPPGLAVKMETGSVFKPEAWATGAKSGSGSLAGIPLCRLLTVWALGEPLSEGAWGSHARFTVLAPAGPHAAGSGWPGSGRELRPQCLSSGGAGSWRCSRVSAPSLQCCQTLLSHRVDPALRDEDGYTAAELAEYHGHRNCAQYLRDSTRPVSHAAPSLPAPLWGAHPATLWLGGRRGGPCFRATRGTRAGLRLELRGDLPTLQATEPMLTLRPGGWVGLRTLGGGSGVPPGFLGA